MSITRKLSQIEKSIDYLGIFESVISKYYLGFYSMFKCVEITVGKQLKKGSTYFVAQFKLDI